MIDVIEAIEILKNNIEIQKEFIEVDLVDSVGYILAENVYSKINVPEFPKSAMDGYVINYLDLLHNDKFDVIDEISADYAGRLKCF